jgi:hypothetical protein
MAPMLLTNFKVIITMALLSMLLNNVPAEAQRAQSPVAIFYAAPGEPDNPICSQPQPCSPQGAVMTCQAQWVYMCRIYLADGLYLDPAVDVYHYKFIIFEGNRSTPQTVVFRATKSNTTLINVQDHATMQVSGVTMDSDNDVTGVWGIAGRQHVIVDYGLVIFGALPDRPHVSMEQFSIGTCNEPVRIIGGGPLRAITDSISQSRILCPVN